MILLIYWHFMIVMPKKKIQHKEKAKDVDEESEIRVLGKNGSENAEEDYTTVVDFESKKKYNKRLIESNWSKYEDDACDFQHSVEDEVPKTDDLKYLLEIASSDCAHFEFSSEKLWRSENNSVPASKIFNLDLDVLSNGLACLPFHERLGLHEGELSAEDKQKFYEEAESNRKEYISFKQKLMKKSQDDPKIKDGENTLRCSNISEKDEWDLGMSNEENEKNECSKAIHLKKGEKSSGEVDLCESKNGDKTEKRKQNIFFCENDENLEGWLDSVLDD